MTKLFQDAVEAASHLPPELQDHIAEVVMAMVGKDEPVIPMSPEETASFAESLKQAAGGDFASEARMQAIWSKTF